MAAYWGKILWIDLDGFTSRVEELSPDVFRQYLGGYGLGLKILCDNQPAGADPFGPNNILAFTPGLLSGTRAFFSGRYMVVGKSPLTGGWGDANCGGSLSPAIKATGYDGIFIRGCSPKPVCIYVTESTVKIKSAEHLWGLDTYETEDRLTAELGPGTQIASIGPGGENLALIAGIFHEKGRTAARSGLGAVMGAKKLKAVAVRGRKKVPVADPALLSQVNKSIALPLQFKLHRIEKVVGDAVKQWVLPSLLRNKIDFNPTVKMIVSSLREHGTGAATAISVESGDAPVKNWKGIGIIDFPWKYSSKISDKSTEPYVTGKYRCANCPLGCGALVSVRDGRYATKLSHRPEYETAAAFGSNILNDNYEAIIKANDLCNRLGLDTISTGAVVAFAMECYERGVITAEDTGGLPLTWGNVDAALQLINDIACRRGLGEILADGVARAAEKLGLGNGEYAIHAGGQELPMHDPRFQPSYGITYVVDATPGRHTAGANNHPDLSTEPLFGRFKLKKLKKYQYSGKGERQAFFAKQFQILNCLGLCNFSKFLGTLPYEGMINAATGWAVTEEELMEIGERILIMRQLFNLREGISPVLISLPERSQGKPPLLLGPTAGITIDLETMRQEYYQALGWDENGVPAQNRCRELGISILL